MGQCLTTEGRELTRVSMVNHERKTVLDRFVLPRNPILDYYTQFSGITAKHCTFDDSVECFLVEGVTTRLEDVQKEIVALLGPNGVLVGHSLEYDMRALKLHHEQIVDTSIIFHSSYGPPSKPALRYLTNRHLKRRIQESEEGHDSIEV